MGNLSPKEVLEFFKSADLGTAELVLEFAGDALKVRAATKAKLAAGMAKARAARKPKGANANGGEGGQAAAQAQVAQPAEAHRGPGRPRVQAPPQTVEATSIESDVVIG